MPRLPEYPNLPSVTEILQSVGLGGDYRHVPAEILVRAQARGRALHRAIELYLDERLDVDSLHPELVPPFEGYLAFAEAYGWESFGAELALVHPHGYVGHPDDYGALTWAGEPETAVIDYKLTDAVDLESAMLQLAGYAALLTVNTKHVIG